MAHRQSDTGTNINAANKSSATVSTSTADEVKPTTAVFHDFLGKGSAPDSALGVGVAAGKVRPPCEASPSASVSIGASSGGGRGPISTTSDLGSERHTGNHFEGVPFYGQRSDFMGPEMSNTFIGTKRSNSDSYVGTSRDIYLSGRPDAMEGSQLMKLLRNAGGERPKRLHDDEISLPVHLMRPISASLVSQPSSALRADANTSKFDRCIQMNVGPTWQYPPRSSQVVPFGHPSNKLRDSNLGPSIASQAAADEGSRTGIKGSGILSSVNTGGGFSDRNLSGVLVGSSKQKSFNISEPESSTAPGRQGIPSSAGCQMTIFYGGKAHVFDNVHPNKADIIMALAGSNGGSWSTTYAPKSVGRPSIGENCTPGGKNDTAGCSFSLQPEVQAKSSVRVNSIHGLTSGDGALIPAGISQEEITMKEAKTSVRGTEVCADKKT